MSLQTSSMVDPSVPVRSEFQSTSFKEVQIEPLTEHDHAVSRPGPIRIADGTWAQIAANIGVHAVMGRAPQPTLQVRIREGIFHYFNSLSHRSDGTSHVPVPRPLLATIEQLSKALHTAGIDIRKLECNAENAMRLAVVASLVETLTPSAAPMAQKRAVAALSKWRLSRVQAYIDENICEPITLEDLAATAGLSRMYFSRQFQAATGLSPHEYVLRKRIERAQQRLAATSDPLVDIGLSVGFRTQAHFTTVFKKFVGYTPLQWRREQPDFPQLTRSVMTRCTDST
jgi:AraC-like DNA-binding protein